MTPCHAFEPGPATVEAVAFACGRCGGDRRRPIEANREAVAVELAAGRARAARRWARLAAQLDTEARLRAAERAPGHAVEVVAEEHGAVRARRWRASCSCGWLGGISAHWRTADADGTEHLSAGR